MTNTVVTRAYRATNYINILLTHIHLFHVVMPEQHEGNNETQKLFHLNKRIEPQVVIYQ